MGILNAYVRHVSVQVYHGQGEQNVDFKNNQLTILSSQLLIVEQS